jgi:hypothetical protein
MGGELISGIGRRRISHPGANGLPAAGDGGTANWLCVRPGENIFGRSRFRFAVSTYCCRVRAGSYLAIQAVEVTPRAGSR